MLMRADPQHELDHDAVVPARPDRRRSAAPTEDHRSGRSTAAYAFCGPAGTLETVRTLTGLPIHYLITVNFQGFRDIVDKLGGVWIDVDRRYFNDNSQGGDTYATINLRPGYQKLNGSQALDFVRFRHTDSDLFRLARQQLFVKAIKQAVNHKVEEPEHGARRSSRCCATTSRSDRAEGRSRARRCSDYAFFAYGLPVGELRPGQDRRADRDERPASQTRRTSRPPSRSSRTRTSEAPEKATAAASWTASCARRTDAEPEEHLGRRPERKRDRRARRRTRATRWARRATG